jgi:hypothetical protein
MIEVAIAFITGVVSPVIVMLVKNKINKKGKVDIVQEALQIGE